MSKSVTMRDIADKLEISVAAVSKALTGKSGVSAELRSKVKRTADEMGYKFDVETKKKSSRSSNIGIIVAERFISDNSFYFKFIHGISKALQQHGNYALSILLRPKMRRTLSSPIYFFISVLTG